MTPKLVFDVIFDQSFLNFCPGSKLVPVDKKAILSLVNDFEDGKWRYDKFQRFIWNNIAETALSEKERKALVGQSASQLAEAAKKCRLTDETDKVGQGSELAEIVLYGIMRNHYNALPVVPKIFHKQNPKDNAKGADSVHIVIEGDTTFSLWFGEAKFYNEIADARLDVIVQSVANSLETEKLKKENSIITNVSDLEEFVKGKPGLFEQIKKLLSADSSIDNIKPILHIPILLLHECPITAKATAITDQYKADLLAFQKDRTEKYFEKQINKISKTVFKYSEIHFHIILFPVPDKKSIVAKFIENVKHHQNQ